MKLYYLVAIITLVSAVLGVAFSINAVGKERDARRTSALYMLARSSGIINIAWFVIKTRCNHYSVRT